MLDLDLTWSHKWYMEESLLKHVDGTMYQVIKAETHGYSILRALDTGTYVVAENIMSSREGLIRFDGYQDFGTDPMAAYKALLQKPGYSPTYYKFQLGQGKYRMVINSDLLRTLAAELIIRFGNSTSPEVSQNALETARALKDFASTYDDQINPNEPITIRQFGDFRLD